MYSHSATPLIPTQSSYSTKSSPPTPTTYAPLATTNSHHLAQTPTHNTYPTFIPPNSTSAPTLLQPTLSDHIHSLRTLSHPQTHPTPSQPDPLPHLNPTHLPHHSHSTNYRTLKILTPPTPICPPRRNDSDQS